MNKYERFFFHSLYDRSQVRKIVFDECEQFGLEPDVSIYFSHPCTNVLHVYVTSLFIFEMISYDRDRASRLAHG